MTTIDGHTSEADQPPSLVVAQESPNPTLSRSAATSAFSAGWMIALLYGRVPRLPASDQANLPTVNELGRSHRAGLILGQLDRLLRGPLAEATEAPPGDDTILTADLKPVDRLDDPKPLQERIQSFHITLLTRLTVFDRRLGEAYSLGRSLCDTCWQPHSLQEFRSQFGKYRLANLQAWMTDLSSCLPECSAAGVSQSLSHWTAWLDANPNLDWDTYGPVVQRAARGQGEQWRSLLSGEKDPKSLLTPEGYVAAGEAALARASRIVRKVVVHFWLPILIIGLVTAGALFIALRYTAGATKFWGSIVSLAAGAGVTGKSVQSTAKQLADDARQPLLNLAESDAIGWAATTLPGIDMSRQQKAKLRKNGVQAPAPDLLQVSDYKPEQVASTASS
jgi:hypothetical protein